MRRVRTPRRLPRLDAPDEGERGGPICALLDRTVKNVGCAPKYTVSDKGPQFRDDYRDWCKRRGVKPRFGAVGKHGSIALIERTIRSVKAEWLRRILVPFAEAAMRWHVERYVRWYNELRPHQGLGGATPFEVYFGREPACGKARFEPRARYPARDGERIRGRRGATLRVEVTYLDGERLLPIVAVKAA